VLLSITALVLYGTEYTSAVIDVSASWSCIYVASKYVTYHKMSHKTPVSSIRSGGGGGGRIIVITVGTVW
jgi:hypothetical protein